MPTAISALPDGSPALATDDLPAARTDGVSTVKLTAQSIANLFAGSGLLYLPNTMDFRLTLETGVPVSFSDQVGKSTIFATPSLGNRWSLYNGSAWVTFTDAEISLALSGLTSAKNYDVFVFDNAGTRALELSAAWATDTARTDALALQDGVLVKSGATTRRWLGTLRTTGTTTTEDSEQNRFVYNKYNRALRRLWKVNTSSHTYGTNAWRPWNNSAPDSSAFFVVGEPYSLLVGLEGTQSTDTTGDRAIIATALDSAVSPTSTAVDAFIYQVTASNSFAQASLTIYNVGIGYHFVTVFQISPEAAGVQSYADMSIRAQIWN